LLVEALFYEHLPPIAARRGMRRRRGRRHCEIISVPGNVEGVPAAIALAARLRSYEGLCRAGLRDPRRERPITTHICAEGMRAGDAGTAPSRDGLAVGFGILTCENEAQALERASPEGRDQGGRAVPRLSCAGRAEAHSLPGSAR